MNFENPKLKLCLCINFTENTMREFSQAHGEGGRG